MQKATRGIIRSILLTTHTIIARTFSAFAVVGLTVCYSLGNLHYPDLNIASFGLMLKMHLFHQYSVRRVHKKHSAIMRYIN